MRLSTEEQYLPVGDTFFSGGNGVRALEEYRFNLDLCHSLDSLDPGASALLHQFIARALFHLNEFDSALEEYQKVKSACKSARVPDTLGKF